MQTKAMRRVKEAVTQLLATDPFFGILLLKLDILEDSKTQTMSVSPKVLRFNPAFALGLSMGELKAVLAHEVMHLALGHHWRQGSRNHELWNHATDYCINARLKRAGFILPNGALLEDRFNDTSSESTYRTLEGEKAKPQEDKGQDSGNGQGESGQDDSQDSGQDSGDSSEDGQGNGASGGDDSKDSQGSAPSPSNGQEKNDSGQGTGAGQEEDSAPTNVMGEFESAGPEDSAESRDAQREWQENVNEAIRVAEKAGRLPADLARELQEANRPKEDWWNLLRRFVSDKAAYTLTWNRPNKRFEDMMLPGKEADSLGPLVVMVDTSCSITQPVLNIFGAHLKTLIQDIQFENLTVIYCDSKVQKVEVYYPGETVNLKVYGGGGTDFLPPFAHVETENLSPVCAVYLTDMQPCYGWPIEPSYPVLWAAYNAHGIVAPWGETIVID